VRDGAAEVVFTGVDHGVERGVEQDYQRSLTIADCLREDVLLAYEMNGAPLPPQHGFPLRLLVPGWYGMAHVKWLTGISVVAEPFDGFQMRAYRLRERPDDEGVPLTRMQPRALLQPPGFPDFMSRTRIVRPGRTILQGRAWSGWAEVTGVEVSVDGGDSWATAELDSTPGHNRWMRWTWPWDATAGRYRLAARAHDATGRSQPVDAPWNRGGFANNGIQRIPVLVLD
jgi:DMSO/TMAO reductase YedYZ molybdopterin-dependent catalytic subunit